MHLSRDTLTLGHIMCIQCLKTHLLPLIRLQPWAAKNCSRREFTFIKDHASILTQTNIQYYWAEWGHYRKKPTVIVKVPQFKSLRVVRTFLVQEQTTVHTTIGMVSFGTESPFKITMTYGSNMLFCSLDKWPDWMFDDGNICSLPHSCSLCVYVCSYTVIYMYDTVRLFCGSN